MCCRSIEHDFFWNYVITSKLISFDNSINRSCLEKWLSTANGDRCEICGHEFTITAKAKPFKQVNSSESLAYYGSGR